MAKGPETTQTTQSTSQPWAPTQPLLNSIVDRMGMLSTDPSQSQLGAVNKLQSDIAGAPSFVPSATNLANTLFSGGGAGNQAGMLTSGFGNLQSQLAGTADPSSVNPYTNPAITGALGTMRNDITNDINSRWAAAGRTGSPGNAQALARGLSQGESGVLMDQYNKNLAAQMGAANSLYGAGNTTAGLLTGMNQMGLSNQLQGMGVAGQIPGMIAQPGMMAMQAANSQFGLPFQNMGMLSNMVTPLAQLGGQTSGTQNTQQVQPLGPQIAGGALGLAGLGGQMFGSGFANPASAAFMFSDVRLKEDIAPVGMLFDNETPVFSYRYKGESTPRIGLLAQDVETRHPEAVTEIGGFKAVDYHKATRPARSVGMLRMAA